jgi:hypothetical protein
MQLNKKQALSIEKIFKKTKPGIMVPVSDAMLQYTPHETSFYFVKQNVKDDRCQLFLV